MVLNTYFFQQSPQPGTETVVRAEQEVIYETVDPLTALVQDVIVSHGTEQNQLNEADDIVDQIIADLEQDESVHQLNEADDIAYQIIADLEQDEAVRHLLHDENHDHDEGIGLNLEDEIGELFDFGEDDI